MKSFRESLDFDKNKPIGRGVTKRVYDHPDKPDKVIAVHGPEYPNIERIKASFYLRKILHFLFPDNISDINLASRDLTILEKRFREEGHLAHQKLDLDWNTLSSEEKTRLRKIQQKFYDDLSEDRKLDELIKTLSDFGVDPQIDFQNYSRMPNGEIQYLDSLYLYIQYQ